MQEEVENRSVNLVVSTTKLTAATIIRAIRWYVMDHNQKKMNKQLQHSLKTGKQSVKKLTKSRDATDKVELPEGSAKDFCRIARKYGIDYAIRQDKTMDPPRYMVFFKAKDGAVLDQAVNEYIRVNEAKEKKKSIRKELREEKVKAKQEAKERAKTKDKSKKQKHRKVRTEGR